MKFLFFILLAYSSLVRAEEYPIDCTLSKDDIIIDKRENYFLKSTNDRTTPLKVNPITGEYSEEEIDLVIAGSEPLSLRRFYNHLAPYDRRYASWRYNPECCLSANFEWKEQEIWASIGEVDGSVFSLKQSDNKRIFKYEIPKDFATFSTSGQSHPLNTTLNFWTVGDRKDKHRFEYHGSITDGSGRERIFKSPMHRWKHFVKYVVRKHGFLWKYEKTYHIFPNTWTPYHLFLEEERLPNGNIICYTYTRETEKMGYPKPSLLKSITAYNRDRSKILGSLQFEYTKINEEVSEIQITGSDGRKATIGHHIPKELEKQPITLTYAKRSGQPTVYYKYDGRNLIQVEKNDGRIFKTEYKNDKIAAQYAPVGPNGEIHPISRYEYQDKKTIVYDAEGYKTIYSYDNKKITSIENACHTTSFEWDEKTGNLLRKTLKDTCNNTMQIFDYQYDKNHNLITEKMGDGSNWHTIHRTYSDDGFNLKLSESDQENRSIRYSYVPHTNLLAAELTYEGNTIRKRIFYTYDDCAIAIKTIIDDGQTENPSNLEGVTYRKITEISPKKEMPCMGLPEVVEEKTIDTSGKELLLSKIIYSYTPFGKILKEDHFDAQATYRYTLINEYDNKERLISKMDALGNTTCFSYDDNHNLLSMTGPREDQYKLISYDRANRPIQISDKQTNSLMLITKKRYDKLGRVITEIDACGNRTKFSYDALGRILAVYHPDEAIERKEYDAMGNVLKEIDALGYETCKTYNFKGQPLSIHYPDGSKELFSYNSSGTLKSFLDKNGMSTFYDYDIFNNPIKTHSLKTTQATYSPFCKLSETDGMGVITFFTYDFAGRKIKEERAYCIIDYTYDALGRLSITHEGDIHIVEEHDLLHQLISKKTLKGALLQSQEDYKYDKAGNRTHTINSQGYTETTYNTFGKPLIIKDALGFTTYFSYSYQGKFTQTITNPKGIQTLSIYNSRGWEIECLKKNPQGEVIQQSKNIYDKNGNRTEQTHNIFSGSQQIQTLTHFWFYGPMNRIERFLEAGEKETRYYYDDRGRLKNIIKADGIAITHEYDGAGRLARYYAHDFDYQYSYDDNDQMTSIYDRVSGQKTTRAYDALGYMIQETLGNGLVLKNAYDEKGRRTQLILPDHSEVDYAYDGIYLQSVCRNGYMHTYVHDLEGNIIRSFLPGNLGEIDIVRDPLGRYKNFRSPYYTAKYLEDAYDALGNLLHYVYCDHIGEEECHYTYDDLDQIISENGHSYHYDSLHNRLKKDEKDHEVNSLCQIVHDGIKSYIYDKCGHLTWDGIKLYSYDSQDRLIRIQEGDTLIEYTYDPFHRRLTKTCYGNKTFYLWDGDNEIGSLNENGKIQELRILGEGLGAEIGAAIIYELEDISYVPIHDHRGCVVALINLEKDQQEYYRYSAFGEELTGNTLSPWRFSSKRVDETGLLFFGRRYYCPLFGRWTTQDPEGFPNGPNLYAYVSNCPLTRWDLYGLRENRGLFNTLYRFFENHNWGREPRIRQCHHLMPNSEIGYLEKSGSYFLKSFDSDLCSPFYAPPIFVNGVLNDKNSAFEGGKYLSSLFGDIDINILHNASHGFEDFYKARLNVYQGKMTAPCFQLRDRLYEIFANAPADYKQLLIGHSQGAAIIRNTLRHCPKHIRENIIVCAIAPAAYIPKHLCFTAFHGISKRDIVPLLDQKGKRQCKDSITQLTPYKNAKLLDHEFQSLTYQEFIGDFFDFYKKLR